jgi:RNA-directed DNA polymerase
MQFLKSLAHPARPERTPADLARWLQLPEAELGQWLSGRPMWADGYDYKRFTIPKRRGGTRQIEAPSDKLKALQRRVLWRLLEPLALRPCATGFVRGRSIVDNARPHVGQGVVINLDLADFFNRIELERVQQVFSAHGWNADAATILARICTSDGRLPQGAPTSPALSNLVCRRLDARLSALAARARGQYTRYADDLTFSFASFGHNKRRREPRPRAAGERARRRKLAGPSRSLINKIGQIIVEEGFRIQRKKRIRVQRAHQRQTATGLVVNQKLNAPRALRRLVRAMQHRARLGKLDSAGQKRLTGLQSFLAMVEKQRSQPAPRQR